MKIKETYQTAKVLAGMALCALMSCSAQTEYTYNTRAKINLGFLSKETGRSVYDLCKEADVNKDSAISDAEMSALENKLAPGAFVKTADFDCDQEQSEEKSEPLKQGPINKALPGPAKPFRPGPAGDSRGYGSAPIQGR